MKCGKRIQIFAVAFLLLLLFAVVYWTEPKKSIQPITIAPAVLQKTLSDLNLEHPEEDVKKNLSRGDFRFMFVCGEDCYAPGVTEADDLLIEENGHRILEGTSDVIESDLHQVLIGKAFRYAESYNRTLLKEKPVKKIQGWIERQEIESLDKRVRPSTFNKPK